MVFYFGDGEQIDGLVLVVFGVSERYIDVGVVFGYGMVEGGWMCIMIGGVVEGGFEYIQYQGVDVLLVIDEGNLKIIVDQFGIVYEYWMVDIVFIFFEVLLIIIGYVEVGEVGNVMEFFWFVVFVILVIFGFEFVCVMLLIVCLCGFCVLVWSDGFLDDWMRE